MLTFDVDVLDNCCGVYEVGNFDYGRENCDWVLRLGQLVEAVQRGTGMFITTHTENGTTCQQAYAELIANDDIELVWESPYELNTKSSNRLKLCVWKVKK